MIYDNDRRRDDDDDEILEDDDLELNSGRDDADSNDADSDDGYQADDSYDDDGDGDVDADAIGADETFDADSSEAGSGQHDYDTPDQHEDDESEDESVNESEPYVRPAEKGKKRQRIFHLSRDDDGDDFYDADIDQDPEPAPKPKAPKLDPEDPDYWIEEESPIRSIMPKPKKIWKWWLGGIATVAVLLCGLWMWFMRPYTEEAVKYGYLKSMERRGSLVKTFEGVLIPYRELGDTTPTYFEEFPFSVESDSVAARMKAMMLGCVPVRIEYEVYRSPLPWKGDRPVVVLKADTADTSKILPPEYR